jgi:hypothetical protein
MEDGSFTGDFERHVKEGYGGGHLSSWKNLYLIHFSAICNLEGSWPYAGPQHSTKASAFWGAQRAC